MTKQLEQTIAKIEALPVGDGNILYQQECLLIDVNSGRETVDFSNEHLCSIDELLALAAEVKWLNYILETIRNMSVYIHEKDPNPDPQFMADFYKTKLADAVDYARKILEGE